MAYSLGNSYRMQVNTGTIVSPTWENVAGEVSISHNLTKDTTEVANKDVGVSKVYKSLRTDATLSLNIQYDPAAASGQTLADIRTLFELTYDDTDLGIVQFKLNTAVVGSQTDVFTAIMTGLTVNYADQNIVDYTLELQRTGTSTLATVS